MTVEEIEIIVTAKVEEALKEFQKIVPSIKRQLNQTQEAFSKIDTKAITNKVNQAVQFIKKKIQDLKKDNTNNELAIKVNNKEASKQISQIQKEIDSLQKKISERELKLNITNGALDKIREETRQEVMRETPDIGAKGLKQRTEYKMLTNSNSAQMIKESDKLNNEIIRYSALLNSAKGKMSELGGETAKTATTQNKLSSFFSAFKQKVGQVIPSIINMKNHFKGLPKVTQNINNNIKGMGGNLKQGLGHVLKYAGALFSIRGIYRLISGAAQSWLSSQNSEAQQLSANIEYLKYSLGSVFAPIIQWITNLVYQLMKAIQSLVYAFSGVNIFAKATAKSMKNASGSAKEAGKSLAGVHTEINNISDNSNGGGTGSVTPNMDLSQMDNTPNSIIDTIKNGDWYQVGAIIGEKLNEAIKNIPWDKVQKGARNIASSIAQTLNGFIATTDWEQVGNTFAQGLNTVIYFGYNFVTTFDWEQYGKAIADSINGFFNNIDWKVASQTLSNGIKGVFTSIYTALEEIDWQQMAKDVEDFVKNIDWGGVAQAIFRGIGAALAGIALFIGTLISDAFTGIGEYFDEKIEECGGNIVAGIFKGIGDAIVGIGQWIYENIFKPFIDGFKNVFGIHSPSTVMEEQGNFIIEGLLNGIKNLLDNVQEIWNNIKEKAIEKFNDMKEKLSEITSNLKNAITEKWNSIKEKASETWNNIKNTADEKWQNIKENVSDKVSTIKSNISNKFNDIKENTKNTWNNIKDKFSSTWEDMKNGKGLSEVVDNIKNSLGGLGEESQTWGKDMMQGFKKGMDSMKSKIKEGAQNIANGIKSFLHFSRPDEGPLRDYETWMPDMVKGLSKTLKNSAPQLFNVTKDLSSKLAEALQISDISNSMIINTGIIPNNFTSKVNTLIDTDKTQPQNILRETFEDVMSNYAGNSGQPMHVTIEYLGKTIFDDTIDYINSKTRRTGKNTIVTVGD